MAGTVTETVSKTGGNFRAIKFACVGDASDGTFPATAIAHKFSGQLLALKTNPGATAPTANYDITLVDQDGHDVLQAVGANRHTSSTEKVAIVYSGTTIHPPVDVCDTLTLTIANSSVNSALIGITLYIQVDV